MSEIVQSIDKEIIRSYNEGDRENALKLFINQYQTKLYALAYQMLGNHDDAMDALQEILFQVNRSLENFQEKSSLYTWVYRLSSNVCFNFRKKRSQTSKQIEWDENLYHSVMLPIAQPNEDPDTMCESKYKQFLIQQAILKLPESQRVLLVLHDIEGISSPEIAKILNINSNAVKSRLHRSRAALRNIINKGIEVKGMEGAGTFSINSSGQLI